MRTITITTDDDMVRTAKIGRIRDGEFIDDYFVDYRDANDERLHYAEFGIPKVHRNNHAYIVGTALRNCDIADLDINNPDRILP